MMDIIALIAAPTITALLAPLVLELVRKQINARKEAKSLNFDLDKYNDQLAHDLREELRSENKVLKEANAALQEKVASQSEKVVRAELWEKRFYALKKEKQNLEFEITLLKKELEELRREYEQYRTVRERAEYQIRDQHE